MENSINKKLGYTPRELQNSSYLNHGFKTERGCDKNRIREKFERHCGDTLLP
jgi:hypothetical protein